MPLIFNRVAGLLSFGVVLFTIPVFAALLPWRLFARAVKNPDRNPAGNPDRVAEAYFAHFLAARDPAGPEGDRAPGSPVRRVPTQ